MAPHSSTGNSWKFPCTEKPARLQSMGSQRVGHNWATSPSPCYPFRAESPASNIHLFVHSLGKGGVLEGGWTSESENLEILTSVPTGRTWASSWATGDLSPTTWVTAKTERERQHWAAHMCNQGLRLLIRDRASDLQGKWTPVPAPGMGLMTLREISLPWVRWIAHKFRTQANQCMTWQLSDKRIGSLMSMWLS